jgi:hypothetical protein
MRIIFCFLFVVILSSCSENIQESNDSIAILDKVTIPKDFVGDSILKIKDIVDDSFPDSTELIIYPFYTAHLIYTAQIQDPVKKIGFIPLTNNCLWSKIPDSSAIESKHLGSIEYEYDNYHSLQNEYRTRFLAETCINENDKVHIYNFDSDTIAIYYVKELSVVAFLSPYRTQVPITQYDYMIGFEIKNYGLTGSSDYLVYIGQSNPFVNGELQPISWKEIDSAKFPYAKLNSQDSARIGKGLPMQTFVFRQNDLQYFVQNIGRNQVLGARHVVIKSVTTKEVVFSRLYSDSESTYLNPLNGVEQHLGNYISQWTGRLFQNRPPAIFGFTGMTFGCPAISFIDEDEPDIWIRCDNRH